MHTQLPGFLLPNSGYLLSASAITADALHGKRPIWASCFMANRAYRADWTDCIDNIQLRQDNPGPKHCEDF